MKNHHIQLLKESPSDHVFQGGKIGIRDKSANSDQRQKILALKEILCYVGLEMACKLIILIRRFLVDQIGGELSF